jgi:hypothetical protein
MTYIDKSDVNLNPDSELDPFWVTGFCDAESSFSMFITKSYTSKIGYTVSPCFTITLHIRDLAILKSIQAFF